MLNARSSLAPCVYIVLLLCMVRPEALEAQPSEAERGAPHIYSFDSAALGPDIPGQTWDVVQGATGRLYAANQQGLLIYDGSAWEHLSLHGLRAPRRVAASPDSTIYVGADGLFGKLTRGERGQPVFRVLSDTLPESAEETIGRVDAVVTTGNSAYFLARAGLFAWDGAEVRLIRHENPLTLRHLEIIGGDVVVFDSREGWLEVTEDALRPWGAHDALQGIDVLFFGEQSDGSLVAASPNDVYRVDGEGMTSLNEDVSGWARQSTVTGGVMLNDDRLALSSLHGGVALINDDGTLYRILDRDTGLPGDDVKHLGTDNQGGLWMAMENGIARAAIGQPLSRLDERHGLLHGVYSLTRHEGTFFVGTGTELYRLDPAETPGAFPRLTSVGEFNTQLFDMASTRAGLLLATTDGVWQFDGNEKRLVSPVPSAYTLQKTPDATFAYVGHHDGVGALRLEEERWVEDSMMEGFDESIRYLEEDVWGTLWASSLESGLWKIERPAAIGQGADASLFASVDSTSRYGYRLTMLGDTLMTPVGSDMHYLAQDETGSYRLQAHSPLNAHLPDEREFLVEAHPAGSDHALAVTSEGTVLLPRSSSGVQMRPTAGMPTLGIFALYAEGGPTVWAGADDRIIRFSFDELQDVAPPPPPTIRRVSGINPDSTLAVDINPDDSLHLDADQTSLRFTFATPSFNHPQETRYQYRLSGLEPEWSEWTDETQKDYTNLAHGEYTFEVRAKAVDGVITEATSASFGIEPPWFRTTWAYLGYILLAGTFIFGLVRMRTRFLEKRNEELEAVVEQRLQEINALNDELKETNEQLRKANSAKSNLLSMAVHDLKNPLASIRGVAEVLEEEGDANPEMLRLIRSSADHMVSMISDLLASAAIESGKLDLNIDSVDLADVGHSVVTAFADQAARKGQALRFNLDAEHSCAIQGDRGRIHEILSNLVSNAIKYSPHDADIRVRVFSNDEKVTFAVTDEGPGLTEEDKAGLFEPFNRLSAQPTGDESSTGLGLHIVRRLTVLHEGEIEVQTELGEGSTFAVHFPREMKRETSSQNSSQESRTSSAPAAD